MGPRSSPPLSSIIEPAVLFGDETSFAVASTLQTHLGTGTRRFRPANSQIPCIRGYSVLSPKSRFRLFRFRIR
jgi:hypothetical protein